MTPAERAAFEKALRAALARRRSATAAGVRVIVASLDEMRVVLRAQLEGAPSDFAAHQVPQLLSEVDRQIVRCIAQAVGKLDELLDAAWRRGPDLIEAPLRAAGLRIGGPLVSDSLLQELKTYAADKVQGLEAVARQRIERHVRLGLLGGQTPHQVMTGIGETLETGPLKYVSFRAETITRTEMGKVHSAAADARLQKAVKVVPGLGKKWRWSGKSRLQHAAINGQTRAADQPFELPDGTRMMYPREAGAPVEHVANCGCESLPWMADWTT